MLDRNPGPPSPNGAHPQFSAHMGHISCGQVAQWIKMPLGRKVGLDPRDIVLDGDPAPSSPKRGQSPNFRPMSIVAKWSPISATAELLLYCTNFLHNNSKRIQQIKSQRLCPCVTDCIAIALDWSLYRLIYFALFVILYISILLVLYPTYIARNVMPTTISTKCMCFFQLIILCPRPYFTRHVHKKSAKPSAF